VELLIHFPHMPSWHGAELKHRDNFTFTFNNNVIVNETIHRNQIHQWMCNSSDLWRHILSCAEKKWRK